MIEHATCIPRTPCGERPTRRRGGPPTPTFPAFVPRLAMSVSTVSSGFAFWVQVRPRAAPWRRWPTWVQRTSSSTPADPRLPTRWSTWLATWAVRATERTSACSGVTRICSSAPCRPTPQRRGPRMWMPNGSAPPRSWTPAITLGRPRWPRRGLTMPPQHPSPAAETCCCGRRWTKSA